MNRSELPILVVQQDPITRKMVSKMLTGAGLEAHETASGDETLLAFGLFAYRAVIIESSLDDMSGEALIYELRMTDPTIPVVVMTNDDSTDCKIRMFGAGADEFIVKPFHRDELIARLNAIFKRTD